MTLSFAGGQDITDTADTALANTTPTGTNENTYDVDNTAPTVGITGVPATSSAPFTATFTFSEAVTGFVVGEIEVGNGAASDFMETSTSVYTALITPASDGLVTVDVAKDVAMDPAGNDNAAATQATSEYTTPDTTAPQVTSIERQTPTTSPTNADRALTWRITFNEDVQNVDAADFTVSGTTATPVVNVVTASTVYDVTASGGDLASLDATVTLSFAGGQNITDTADTALANTTPTGTNENTYDVDNTAPTVGITGVPATSSAPFTATFTFSEAVTGFVVGDIEVGNGAASDFMETSTSVYTALITPASDGEVTVDVAKDVAMDPAGNDNAAATQAMSEYTTPDTTAPQVTSIERQTPTTSPTNADSLTWRITFNEDVQNVDAADFTVSGTTATLEAELRCRARPHGVRRDGVSGGDLAGLNATVTLSFAGGQDIADTADTALANTTPTGTNENTYDVDNTAPTVGITGVPATSSAPFTATFTFSEAVTGFVVGEIEVGNGAASDFMETSTSVYTALITPASDGLVTVDVAMDVAMDPAGNDNAAATQATSEYTTPDTTAPQVTSIERQTPTTSPTNADSLTWRITFNEDVQNVDAADFTVSGTTATPVVNVVTASTVYDVTASGGDLASLDATVTLSFAGGQNITDTADTALANTTPTGTNENTYDVDNTAPTVGITGVPATSSAPFTATFTFSEAVTGFVVGEIEVGNGVASDFMETSTSVYTALITPASDGLVTVDVAKDVAMDPAGNDNAAATQATSEYTTPDTTAPQVTSIERQTPTTSPTNADGLTWRITFNEDVQNVDAADFTVSGTTATLAVREETASTGYDVTASGGDLASLDATVTLSFAGGQNITDTADTALANTTPTGTNENTYDVDNTAPTVGITGVPATSSAPFTATFTFSEAVTGFVVGDIEVATARPRISWRPVRVFIRR